MFIAGRKGSFPPCISIFVSNTLGQPETEQEIYQRPVHQHKWIERDVLLIGRRASQSHKGQR